MPNLGGMKGCMVPGDAHPYLAPYNEYDKKVEIARLFSCALRCQSKPMVLSAAQGMFTHYLQAGLCTRLHQPIRAWR